MRLAAFWKTRNLIAILLLPLAGLFIVIAALRRLAYRGGWIAVTRLDVPVIVVGNITAGGSGKTPLVIEIVRQLRRAGLRPGVVSRGYGGTAKNTPQRVTEASDPRVAGDEPLLIARATQCPVAVGLRRAAAAQLLLADGACDVIVSDDGLQHYALARDFEIAVVDRASGFGNGWRLPAGPLRESVARLTTVDAVVYRGDMPGDDVQLAVVAADARNLSNPQQVRALAGFSGQPVHAVAGIGVPERFFAQLRAAGLTITEHAFADHHAYTARDLAFGDANAVLMTEKDAVKCASFAEPRFWSVGTRVMLDAHLVPRILERIHSKRLERQHG